MRRSRSPVRFKGDRSREKSFSMSSLSDCSLGRSPKKYIAEYKGSNSQSRSYMDLQNKVYRKGYDVHKLRGGEKDKRSFKTENNQQNRGKSYSSSVAMSHKKTYDKNSQRHNEFIPTSITKDKDKTKGDDRLQRLEHMVELLINTKSNKEIPKPASMTLFEFNPRDTSFTTSMWLNKINDECMEKNLGDQECIQFIQSKMTGLIKAWFKTLDIFDYTWPEIKMLIISTFPDNVDFAATLRLLVNRQKKTDETVTQYYFSKMYLLEACKITGANAVSVLIDGLNDPYWQKNAKSFNFQNPEVFYTEFLFKLPNFGLQIEPMQRYQQTHSMGEKSEVPIDHFKHSKQSYEFKSSEHLTPQAGDLRYSISHSRSDKKNKKDVANKNKACYVCGDFGHLAISCLKGQICYLCNKHGHIASKCPSADDIGSY